MWNFFCLGAYVVFLWLLFSEFSYLPRAPTRWIYDRFSTKYERKWLHRGYDVRTNESLFIAPLQSRLAASKSQCVLDVACGTGRVARLLLSCDWFHGRILAVDFSSGMLRMFRQALCRLPRKERQRVSLIQDDLMEWRPADNQRFDAVTFLEASEFVPQLEALVMRIEGLLKPGGLFVLTKVRDRWAWMFPGRSQSSQRMRALLESHSFDVTIRPWRWRYDVVYAIKIEESQDTTR